MNEPSEGKWISVKDRLPRHGETILISFGRDRVTGMARYFPHSVNQWVDSVRGNFFYFPDHWMPLPDPPTVDPFLEWWDSLDPVDGDPVYRSLPIAARSRVFKGIAQFIWNAALASRKP